MHTRGRPANDHSGRRGRPLLAAVLVGVAVAPVSFWYGQVAADDWEPAARALQQATVTVRIWERASGDEARAAVTVCSGVCVRDSRVVTAAFAGSDSPIRLTIAGGQQADARLLVIDEYSGLALLRATTAGIVPVRLADQAPAVGSDVLTAAAWGLEEPLVARGIVGGVDRQHPSARFPPLLQCDVLTSQTSTGAGVVDRNGNLLGVAIAADAEGGRRGWMYAVPASHVARLLRAADEYTGDGVVILKRRRPVVGMVLGQAAEAVIVEHVTTDGPAAKAGIQTGDQVLATDGVAIRSVYQAILPTLHKQPGDTSVFRVRREGAVHDVTVVLGGGVEVDAAPAEALANLIQPKVRMARDGEGLIVTSRGQPSTATLAAGPPLPMDTPPAAAPTPAEQIALLESALKRYQTVIEWQQKRLADEQQKRRDQEALLQSLRAEMEALRQAIGK